MRLAIVGSRKMSSYGKQAIGLLMRKLVGKCEVVTIDVGGCNREVIRYGADKVFRGENFEILNYELAEYADILVVIEGGKLSGTLLLASIFAEKGKQVYCVPGRIIDESSWAPNWLISQGAMIITSIESLTSGDMIVDNG